MATNKKHTEDKFYTKDNVISKIIKFINLYEYDLIIEPSAGDGSFINHIEEYNYIAIDISPEDDRIIKKNWFEFYLESKYRKILVLGNPPFGNQGGLAMKFFIKSASLDVDTIAFILPKSFKKKTIQNRIPVKYHLIKEIDLDDDSFTLLGENYSVPCVFQIWKKKDFNREIIKFPTKTKYFDFVKKKDNPEISFRRVGFYAGLIYDDVDKSEQSHYFIKSNGNMNIQKIKEILNNLKWEHNNTAGPRSIGKGELIVEFEKKVV